MANKVGPDGMGVGFRFILTAKGIKISMADARAVTFVVYEDDGATQSTFTQHSSKGVGSEIALGDTELGAYDGAISVGKVAVPAARTTNSSGVIVKADGAAHDVCYYTVLAEQLAEGYDIIECTTDGSAIVHAIVHGLKVRRDAANLPELVVA